MSIFHFPRKHPKTRANCKRNQIGFAEVVKKVRETKYDKDKDPYYKQLMNDLKKARKP